MRSSTAEINQNEDRLREYQRQQERLKAMTVNADKIKSVSADVMIENLLKQNFVKPVNKSVENKINSKPGLPNWLECESPEVPGPYKHLWNLVKTATNYADTQKVSQLLLTSGLPTEVLGYIWNMSNNEVPGQLNKQEFFIVLALVALAQTGYTFNNLSILNFVPTAPIPALQTIVIENYGQSQNAISNSSANELSQVRPVNEEPSKLGGFNVPTSTDYSFFNASTSTTLNKSLKDSSEVKPVKKSSKLGSSKEFSSFDSSRDFSKKSNFPFIGSSPTAELEDDDFSEFQSVSVTEPISQATVKKEDPKPSVQQDEFTDFQCADIGADPLGTLVLGQKKEIPKIHFPKSLTGKISNLRTNILKISPESEKKLKVLTQSESLSSLPESKISTNNIVSTMPSISVLGGSRDIGMRLAHHSLGSKTEKVKHQRHYKHKQQPVHADDTHFSSKFGSIDELFPKCFQKSSSGSKTFVLKETKIGNVDVPEPEAFMSDSDPSAYPYQSSKNTRKIEIPMLGTFNETTLPTQTENTIPCQQPTPAFELFSLEEDKYSALREVELEMKLKNSESQIKDVSGDVNPLDSGDDFGEFLSADIPSSAPAEEADLWGEWKDNGPEPQPMVDNPSDSQKDLGESQFVRAENISNPVKETENCEDTKITVNMDLLSLDEGDCTKTLDRTLEFDTEITDNKWETKCSLAPELIPVDIKAEKVEDKSQDFDDFIMLDNLRTNDNSLPNSSNLQTTIVNEKAPAADDFAMLFATDITTAPPEISVDDSLPSLDLKILPTEANANAIRKKCLTACLSLMQQALEILGGVTSSSVLQEIFSTEEAINYLNNLNIISHISRRTSSNCCEVSGIQEEIERIWQKLINFCNEYNIRLKKDMDSDASIGVQCYVCLGFIGHDIIEQGINSYHPSCANLWINCIDSELPCPI